MGMATIHKTTQTDENYLLVLKALRTRNFSKNLPFLLLSDKLPEGQVYREFADGHMEIQEVFSVGAHFQHKVLRVLPSPEADKVRSAYGLL
jgi:hypothetical protein